MTAKRKDKAAFSVRNTATTPHFSVVSKVASDDLREVSVDQEGLPRELSVRAENVLKMLALELTGDEPPGQMDAL